MAICDNIDKHITELENDKNKTLENIAGVRFKINEINDFLNNNQYSETSKEYHEVSNIVSTFDKVINNTLLEYNIEDISHLKDFHIYLEKQISSLESQIESLSIQVPVLLTEREAEYKKLQEKQQQLNSMNSDNNLTNIVQNLKEYKRKSQEYEHIFSQMGLLNINIITKDEFNTAIESINNLKNMAAMLIAQYSISDIEYVISHKRKVMSDINTVQDKRFNLDVLKSKYTDLSKKDIEIAKMK